jgi:phage FluMu gp28-like protein
MTHKPRRWRGNEGIRTQLRLDFKIQNHHNRYEQKVKSLETEPTQFFKQILEFEPFSYQQEVIKLFQENQFLAIRWCRQSGKSWTISALLLNHAIRNDHSHIAVVGPSWRQTKLNLSRISYFTQKLKNPNIKTQKTRITFPNSSTIEAFPNSPDTIRGPTFNIVWWDETNFTANDNELYDAILFTLGTTEGKLVCTSTPWNTDSLFWKMCNHKNYTDYARHHVAWQQAQEPSGPLKKSMLNKIRTQFGEDPSRWRREMEAEWAEDEDVWLPQSLIVNCIGTAKTCGEDLQPWNPEKGYRAELFAGLDLAQAKDYCVLTIFQRLNEKLLLRHLKIFHQPTKYAHVLGYLKMLQDRWSEIQKIRVDFTKEGPSIISDMENAGIRKAEGVNFSLPRKSEMAGLLKQRMMNGQVYYPHLTWEKPYRSDLCSELNVERFELRKDGAIALSHPSGSHDDVFWSLALAVYATVDMKEFDLEALRFG